MRKIVKNRTEDVSIDQATALYWSDSKIIAYEVGSSIRTQGNGLAVLRNYHNNSFGFVYVSQCIRGIDDFKYIKASAAESIEAVIDDGKKIMVFDNMRELMYYAVEHGLFSH